MLKALKITTNKIKVALYVYLYTYKVKNIKEGKHSLIIIHLWSFFNVRHTFNEIISTLM